MVITRFAPSPTGFLHIGSARTALFNYLFAKNQNGKFLLRIEDTDRERSTQEAVEAIFEGLKWLGINWDEEVIFQSKRNELYKQAAIKLVNEGKAYYCFASSEELTKQRNLAIEKKENFIFRSEWRDSTVTNHPSNAHSPVIRLKIQEIDRTIIKDLLQGDVVVDNSQIEDFVLLRSDGTATYMLAVVVDDIDMKITHIIRGDDHLTNAAKQILIYQAMNGIVPQMIHIPLIHGTDGAKLSKRHGALGVDAYKNMGYLPETLINYLLRLGWANENQEIFSIDEAIKLFNLKSLGKSPAKLDFTKMNSLNAHYLKEQDNNILLNMIIDFLPEYNISDVEKSYILTSMNSLKIRAKTLIELAELSKIYLFSKDIEYSNEAKLIIDNCNNDLLKHILSNLEIHNDFSNDSISNLFKKISIENNMKLADLMLIVRVFLTGKTSSPSLFEIISIIGKENTIKRIKK